MMGNENYSSADLGLKEDSPKLDWVDEQSLEPEELAQLHKHSQRLKHPTSWEQQQQAWMDGISRLSDQEFQKQYF